MGAAVARNRPELRADLQRFYNIDDYEGAARARGATFVADLVACLPYGSALRRAVDPAQDWTVAEHMLALIEYDLRRLAWSLGGGKGSKPKPIKTPDRSARERRAIGKTDIAAMRRVAEALNVTKEVFGDG